MLIGVVAILLVGIGFLVSYLFKQPKAVSAESTTIATPPIDQFGISKREYEILELMAQGFSTAEISEKLFISINTVKTHVSKILMKLDAKRRTQAIQKARQFKLIP